MIAQNTQEDDWREGIKETFAVQIDEAQTQEEREEVARLIREAVDSEHLYKAQADELFERLGMAEKKTEKETREEEEDRLAWEAALREVFEKARTVALELEDLKAQTKAAKEESNRLDAEMKRLICDGSKGFKSRKLF